MKKIKNLKMDDGSGEKEAGGSCGGKHWSHFGLF